MKTANVKTATERDQQCSTGMRVVNNRPKDKTSYWYEGIKL